MAYPHKWSTISYKSSAGQRKYIGQRPMLYVRWTTPPTMYTMTRKSLTLRFLGQRSCSAQRLALPSRMTTVKQLLTLLLTLCGLTSQKTHRRGLGLSGSVDEEAHPCFPYFSLKTLNALMLEAPSARSSK